MLQNIQKECNYHQVLSSNQMSETEPWKLLLSKFFLNNHIITQQQQLQNQSDNHDRQEECPRVAVAVQPDPEPISDNQAEVSPVVNETAYTMESITPHSSASNNTLLRPKSSISQESWPNTSDDGSISRHTPESSFEEYPAKGSEFSLEERTNPKFLRSLLVGGDPNQIKSYSSLLTSRVAMCNNFDLLLGPTHTPKQQRKDSDDNPRSSSDEETNISNNNIDDMLLYLLKFLRKKMESQEQLKKDCPPKKWARDDTGDGSLLSNLISETDAHQNLLNGGDSMAYRLSKSSQKELRVIRKNISDEYSSLFKMTGHANSLVSRNLEARLTILEMLRRRTRLDFETNPPTSGREGLPKKIVELFNTVVDENFPLIAVDENIFRMVQSAVISQECYPRIVKNTCHSIMRNLHEYLGKINASDRFIDFLLLMTNINSVNLSHFQVLYNSLVIDPFEKSFCPRLEQLEISRKRRASRQDLHIT